MPTIPLFGESPGPGSARDSPGPSTMMKSSFSQVVEPSLRSSTGTPVNGSAGDRAKVAFGFGTKRKANEDGEDTPPSKRR